MLPEPIPPSKQKIYNPTQKKRTFYVDVTSTSHIALNKKKSIPSLLKNRLIRFRYYKNKIN